MRFLTTLIVLGGMGYGIYWLNNTQPELKHQAIAMINTSTCHALEARYTAAQIMEKERSTLLKDSDHRYSSPLLRFHPYLLMEVKFTTADDQTEEGMILWDLVDGEMVLDTKSWDKTHGFADCIHANADEHDYKILTTIAKNGGKADHQSLMSSLNMETHLFEKWVDRARKKKLIVQHGNDYRIHLRRPVVNVPPATKIVDPLVTKNCKQSEKIHRRYSPSQIKKAAEAAFGTNFAIRSTQDVFLPIYSITVQNSDGSLRTTHWNALTGKQSNQANLIE
ncbi:MAG: hypothetical protein QNJ27_01790 [Simkaniaceae bacterium]|nr:hypothetical protein [Simkaniaceae bacterium]